MFFANGMVYGDTPKEMMKIVAVKPLENMTMILTFNSGEQRLYDATELLKYPIFQVLKDKEVFLHPVLDHGVVTWNNGALDLSPDAMYENSFPYEKRT